MSDKCFDDDGYETHPEAGFFDSGPAIEAASKIYNEKMNNILLEVLSNERQRPTED